MHLLLLFKCFVWGLLVGCFKSLQATESKLLLQPSNSLDFGLVIREIRKPLKVLKAHAQ